MDKNKILVVDDDPNILYAIKIIFEKEDYQVVVAESGQQGIDLFERVKPDLIFMDVTMPDASGLEIMQKIRENVDVPVIVITGFGTMDTAIKAVQLGAYEYITKPLDAEKIRLLARRALETYQLRKEIEGLRLQLDGQVQPYTLIGNGPAMQEVYKAIGAITTTPNTTTVLVQGESGTGKELVARAIHNNSPNASEPFIVVNCTVLPEELLESELFGHEKGAFTGAFERKIGKLELARAGTIFLDEIAELTPKLQGKLLRLLQEREFERIGGHEAIKVDARFIIATNRNLEEAVKCGQFREDLYFRIAVVVLSLPPLRERKEDIPLLLDHFVKRFSVKLGKQVRAIGPGVIEMLNAYDYPGNVREFENMIERSIVLSKGDILTREAFATTGVRNLPFRHQDFSLSSMNLEQARREALDKFEKKFLKHLLAETGGNISEAARLAGIRRQSLHRMLKRHNLIAQQSHTK